MHHRWCVRVPEDLPSPLDKIRSSVVGAVTGFQLPAHCTIFDKLKNDALDEPQRYAMFLDCLTEAAGNLRAEIVRLQRQITELAFSRSSAIFVPSGTVSDNEQSSDPTARIMSITRMCEGLSKALTSMRRAHTFPHGVRVLSPSSIASHLPCLRVIRCQSRALRLAACQQECGSKHSGSDRKDNSGAAGCSGKGLQTSRH